MSLCYQSHVRQRVSIFCPVTETRMMCSGAYRKDEYAWTIEQPDSNVEIQTCAPKSLTDCRDDILVPPSQQSLDSPFWPLYPLTGPTDQDAEIRKRKARQCISQPTYTMWVGTSKSSSQSYHTFHDLAGIRLSLGKEPHLSHSNLAYPKRSVIQVTFCPTDIDRPTTH